MTFLPILVRELRTRGRGATTWWGRTAVATLGVLVCVPSLLWMGPFAAPGMAGRAAFNALLGAAFLLCCGACLLTADAVSRERREGTLGLLLLTRVSHWDILLGKCASVGFGCLAGLLAFLPVLALPLLAGGTTAGETVRDAAGLFGALFLALAAGLCASSFCFDRFRSACLALFLMAALVLVPVLLGLEARLASPLGTLFQAADLDFKASPPRFWISLGLVQFLGWVLLWFAVLGLRKRAEHAHGPRIAKPAGTASLGEIEAAAPEVICRYCGRRNPSEAVHCHECGTELHPKPPPQTTWTLASAPSPLHWLLRRQRGIEPMLWLAAILAAFQAAFAVIVLRFLRFGTAALVVGLQGGLSLVVLAIAGALIATAASRFVIEARRDGTLELLLTTPLGADQLMSTQWEIIKRMIWLPLLTMLAPSLLQGLFIFLVGGAGTGYWKFNYALSLFASIANMVLSVGALCWVAQWFAFSGMSQARTIFWTVLVAHGLPYVFNLGWVLLVQVMVPLVTSFPGRFSVFHLVAGSLLPQMGTFVFYLLLIRLARSRLLDGLHRNEPVALRLFFVHGIAAVTAAIRCIRRWPSG